MFATDRAPCHLPGASSPPTTRRALPSTFSPNGPQKAEKCRRLSEKHSEIGKVRKTKLQKLQQSFQIGVSTWRQRAAAERLPIWADGVFFSCQGACQNREHSIEYLSSVIVVEQKRRSERIHERLSSLSARQTKHNHFTTSFILLSNRSHLESSR